MTRQQVYDRLISGIVKMEVMIPSTKNGSPPVNMLVRESFSAPIQKELTETDMIQWFEQCKSRLKLKLKENHYPRPAELNELLCEPIEEKIFGESHVAA